MTPCYLGSKVSTHIYNQTIQLGILKEQSTMPSTQCTGHHQQWTFETFDKHLSKAWSIYLTNHFTKTRPNWFIQWYKSQKGLTSTQEVHKCMKSADWVEMYNKPQQVSVWPGEWAQRSFSQKNMFLCLFVVVFFFRGNLTELDLAWTSFFWMIMESFMSLRRSEPVLTGEHLSIIHGWMDGWMDGWY